MDRTGSPVDLDPEQVNELARNFWYSAILRAGIKLDVFSILEGANLTSEEVARRIGASPRYVQAFLECCGVLDLLEKEGDQFTNSPLTSRFLVKNKKEYVGDHALHHTNTWASWGRLDEIVREGKTLLPYETGFVDAPTYWTDYMIGQHNRAESGQARHLVESLDLSGKRKMLDLGGGAASYSIALCAANPDLQAVVLDQKEPLEIARPLVEQHGLGQQITLLEGDFLDTNLESDYDVVLISGVVLIKSEADCQSLFKVAYGQLRPKGMIIIQDYMRLDHSATRQKLDAMEDMYVLVAFDPGAGDREGDLVESWLVEAGFLNTKMIPLPTQLAVITAEKP